MSRYRVLSALLIAVMLGACVTPMGGRSQNSSSLVSFLYPDGHLPPATGAVPELHLPLRVGLAFLPSAQSEAAGLDEAHKAQLLERIRQRFVGRPFVSDITVIPDYYLANRGGYPGLEALKRLYSFDVLALVSYDQVTNVDANRGSLTYLTIVGAFIVDGINYDTATLVDLAVVDPATRSLILRAGGTDSRHSSATLVKVGESVRKDAAASFDAATDRMIANFDGALNAFEQSVHDGKAQVRVVDNRAGGGGALNAVSFVAFGALGALAVGMRRRQARARQPSA